MKNVFKIQPVWLIKKYFGDKVGKYIRDKEGKNMWQCMKNACQKYNFFGICE